MNVERGGSRQGVPTLTEVVTWPEAAAVDAASEAQAPAPLASLPSEAELTQRVLGELQHQIDLMLEYRLREVLTPLLARAADGLVRDARGELASSLREVVARAVAKELSRHRGR